MADMTAQEVESMMGVPTVTPESANAPPDGQAFSFAELHGNMNVSINNIAYGFIYEGLLLVVRHVLLSSRVPFLTIAHRSVQNNSHQPNDPTGYPPMVSTSEH